MEDFVCGNELGINAAGVCSPDSPTSADITLVPSVDISPFHNSGTPFIFIYFENLKKKLKCFLYKLKITFNAPPVSSTCTPLLNEPSWGPDIEKELFLDFFLVNGKFIIVLLRSTLFADIQFVLLYISGSKEKNSGTC